MKKLAGMLCWVVTVAAALFPMLAEARLAANDNQTLVREEL
jgi:hypothetical protein